MKPKKPSRREIGLNLIKSAGYHGKPYQLLAIDYRISYEVAREYYQKGQQAKESGMKCHCLDCNPTNDLEVSK